VNKVTSTSSKYKGYIKQAIKFLVTAAALLFVFKKIDVDAFKKSISDVNLGYMALGWLVFNISKIISAFRLNLFYKLAGIRLSGLLNLRFYYLGMFYNMFLPGSVGGDAYKVYLLKENNEDASTKKLIAATLLDRISGVALLAMMAGVFLYLSSYSATIILYEVLLFAGILLIMPGYYLFMKWFFPTFVSAYSTTGMYSFFVQLGQVISAWLILKALHIDSAYWDYLTLFMISSVFAVIPLTIGGFGAREMVFLFGSQYLLIQEAPAVAFAVLFFATQALSSLLGLLFLVNIDKKIAHATSNSQ
jgi:uncharacterized membrane protein YbhN (UPF0104 family)